ncbi:hypothetical protein DPEC_G00246530 [Dallia pectoralis]|uniref:Uncharacterized protein n=1 Tax=Dallia pectoralis TaxID=75939 RepID=A0ACC2FWI0_DALPE|nr:hypothetical protein DPEC_G00246530 [Dallia pectoralis]
MVSQGLQMMGIVMSLIGWLMVIIACALPMWRVTAFIGANIVTAQTIWEGMWMNCVVQSTGQMQCKIYDSMLALPQDLQAARAMTIISVLTGVVGICLSIAGGKCTNCITEEGPKAKACILAGVLYITSGILILIPVSWSANTIIRDFYNPMMMEAQRRELGASLYIGWGAAILLFIGGGMLCWNCPPKQDGYYPTKFTPVRFLLSQIVDQTPHTALRIQTEKQQNFSRSPETQPPVMGRIGKEVTAQVLAVVGLVGVALTTGIPMWRVTSYIGANIVTAQIVWDGLWMNCVMQATGQMQCKINYSVMSLSTDLQASGALVVISIIVSFVGLLFTFIGGKCTSCLKSDSSKSKMTILGGALLILGAVLVIIPVSWSAAITIFDYNNPLLINTQKRELGASIYIGWGAGALLIIAGILLCSSCPPEKEYGYPGYPQGPHQYPYPGQPMVQAGPYGRIYTPTSRPYSGTGSYGPGKPYAAPTTYAAPGYPNYM